MANMTQKEIASNNFKTHKLDQLSMVDEFGWQHGHGGKHNGAGFKQALKMDLSQGRKL